MSAPPKPFLTAEEYLELELQSEIKHEYHDGEMFAMGGGTPEHGAIAINLAVQLSLQLRDRPCRVFSSDVRIKVEATGLYTYPDLSVVCGALHVEAGRGESVLNPLLIVEVLSPSTEAYDRGTKFENYRTIPSVQEYLLVSTDKPMLERFTRQADGSWNLVETKGLESRIGLLSVDCELELSEVYAKVEFKR